MDAALVFQAAVGAAPSMLTTTSLMPPWPASLSDISSTLPALALGVTRVTAVDRQERRFLAAGAGANLEHDVALVVGILRNQQQLELVRQALPADVEIVELLEREIAHFRIAALDQLLVVGDLPLDRLMLPVGVDDRLDLRQRLGLLADARSDRSARAACRARRSTLRRSPRSRPTCRTSTPRHRRQKCDLVAVGHRRREA